MRFAVGVPNVILAQQGQLPPPLFQFRFRHRAIRFHEGTLSSSLVFAPCQNYARRPKSVLVVFGRTIHKPSLFYLYSGEVPTSAHIAITKLEVPLFIREVEVFKKGVDIDFGFAACNGFYGAFRVALIATAISATATVCFVSSPPAKMPGGHYAGTDGCVQVCARHITGGIRSSRTDAQERPLHLFGR